MKYIGLLAFLILLGCNKEENLNSVEYGLNQGFPFVTTECEKVNPYILSAESDLTSIILFYIPEQIGNSQKVCKPDVLDILISKDSLDFELTARVNIAESPFRIEGLETNTKYFIKAIHIHSYLEHFETNVISITTGIESLPCTVADCDILNPFSFIGEGEENSIVLYFGQSTVIDAFGKVCDPDAIDFYISEDNISYEKIVRRLPSESPYYVSGLENGKRYFFKMVNVHCELNPIHIGPIVVTAGKIPLPNFIDNPVNNNFEDFRLSKDQNQFVFRNYSNDWRLTSFDNPGIQQAPAYDAFHADWNPQNENEVAFVLQQKIDNAWKTKSLVSRNTETYEQTILHEVVDPDAYWIHEIKYALNENSIYFKSNKDHGGTGTYDHLIYENIFRLNIETKEIEMISDFTPEGFEISDYVEDPNSPGNFYILGGIYGEDSPPVVGFPFPRDKIDAYYFDSTSKLRTKIFDTDYEEKYISIDGRGENLVFVSNQTGLEELWSFNLMTQEMKQITNRIETSPSYRWHHINWISDTEFMVFVEHEGVDKFAVYSL